MNFRKCTIALAVAAACTAAQASVEVPLIGPPDVVGTADASNAKKQVVMLGDLDLGQGTAGLAIDPVSRKAYVSNYTSGTLSVIDLDTLVAEQYPVGANPRRLAHNSNLQRTYIVNDTTPGTVTVFDAKANEVIATIPVGRRPRSISADFAQGEVYVANLDSNTMSVIDVGSNTVVAEVSVGSAPFMGDVDRIRGHIYVVSQLDRSVHVIDQATKQVIKQVATLSFPNAATVDPRTGKVYVNSATDNVVQIMDPVTLQFYTQLPTGGNSTFGSISDIYRRYYLPNQNDYTVTVIDIDNDEVVKTVTTGASPQQVAIEGVDGNYYVVNRLGNNVSVFDARNDREIGAFAVGVNPWRIGVGMDKVLALNENGNRLDSVSIAEELNTLGDTTAATEWYHTGFDHFFHSTSGRENRLLNDGMLGQAWDRTYEFFRVWTQGGPNRVQVCRFFSTAFGAKSSHFYTASADECEALKAGTDWQFEAMTYYVELPDAAGNCREGTTPLLRLYNNGMGGAPNHRFTIKPAVRDKLSAEGWVSEGVAACVPSLRGDEL